MVDHSDTYHRARIENPSPSIEPHAIHLHFLALIMPWMHLQPVIDNSPPSPSSSFRSCLDITTANGLKYLNHFLAKKENTSRQYSYQKLRCT